MNIKVRWAEDIEMVRYGINLPEKKYDRKIKTTSLAEGTLLHNFLRKEGIELEILQLVRQVDKYGETILDFYDLVYVNGLIKSDLTGKISDYQLEENDFVLISRTNSGKYIPEVYPWAVYQVEDRRKKSSELFRNRVAKRIVGLRIFDVLKFDNYFKREIEIMNHPIKINNNEKGILDRLEWGDRILIEN